MEETAFRSSRHSTVCAAPAPTNTRTGKMHTHIHAYIYTHTQPHTHIYSHIHTLTRTRTHDFLSLMLSLIQSAGPASATIACLRPPRTLPEAPLCSFHYENYTLELRVFFISCGRATRCLLNLNERLRSEAWLVAAGAGGGDGRGDCHSCGPQAGTQSTFPWRLNASLVRLQTSRSSLWLPVKDIY